MTIIGIAQAIALLIPARTSAVTHHPVLWDFASESSYPVAIARVALIGSFSVLHKAAKLPSLGRQ
jgi:hypothetical protein